MIHMTIEISHETIATHCDRDKVTIQPSAQHSKNENQKISPITMSDRFCPDPELVNCLVAFATHTSDLIYELLFSVRKAMITTILIRFNVIAQILQSIPKPMQLWWLLFQNYSAVD